MEVAPALLVALEDLGRLLEQAHGLEQQVIEVEGLGFPQPLLVARREARDRAVAVVDRVLGEERRVEHLVLRTADRAEHDRRAELAGQRHVLLAEDLLHQRLLVVGVVDDEPAIDADRLAVLAKHAGAQRMEGARLDVPAGLADEADDPLAQLRGRAVRERDREDLPGRHVLHADEVRDPVGEDARLARAGAGQDQQRPFGGRDRPRLLRVEAVDDLLGPALAGRRSVGLLGGPDRRIRRRRGLVPGTRGVTQPLGLLGGCRRALGDVVELGADGRRGVVERARGLPPSGGGTHRPIVGGGP